jgi:hypothetical protein
MSFYRLTKEQVGSMIEEPEVAMDIHIVRLGEDGRRKHPAIIVGCRLAITYDEHMASGLSIMREFMGIESIPTAEEYGARLLQWTSQLDECPRITTLSKVAARNALALIHLGPLGVQLGVPRRPSFVYGHLPFHGTCSGSDIFYRYEAFPTSLRIDQPNQRVARPDTYAAPESEERFTPTGLSAVGRFALPSLSPACWRWKLTPVAPTSVYYGASVPLYGQSGGAVEVMFPQPFSNAVAIPNPHVLPIL